jgi:pimeloyl-ACP methyl ester carboxylesterase
VTGTDEPTTDEPIHLGITDTGEGPTVVFTHGWVDDRTVWDGVIAQLTDASAGATAHCVSWDLRGHGDSDAPPPGNYTREHALADMERIVTAAGTPCVLAGHSLGGYLSLAYALLHPDQVAGLILVAAGPGFRKDEAREQWNASVDASAAKLELPEGSEVISKHVDSWVIDHLGDITAPTLVIVGEHDKRFAASAAVFEKTLDVRSSVVVPDAGHSVHRKAPEPVAAAIRPFLTGLTDGT